MREYKSPSRKLIPWFLHSRNQWKKKCQAAKYGLKKARQQVRYLKEALARERAGIPETTATRGGSSCRKRSDTPEQRAF